MAGVMPKTALLLTNTIVIGEFNNYTEISYHLGISIDSKGYITFMGNKVYPSYIMSEFTASEAISDWSRNYLCKNLPSEYKIYRYLL